jgi:predicted KAP-like P-loop ATPase
MKYQYVFVCVIFIQFQPWVEQSSEEINKATLVQALATMSTLESLSTNVFDPMSNQ